MIEQVMVAYANDRGMGRQCAIMGWGAAPLPAGRRSCSPSCASRAAFRMTHQRMIAPLLRMARSVAHRASDPVLRMARPVAYGARGAA